MTVEKGFNQQINKALEAARHHDNLIWKTISIFLASILIFFGLILSYNNSENLAEIRLLGFIIGSVFMLFMLWQIHLFRIIKNSAYFWQKAYEKSKEKIKIESWEEIMDSFYPKILTSTNTLFLLLILLIMILAIILQDFNWFKNFLSEKITLITLILIVIIIFIWYEDVNKKSDIERFVKLSESK